MKHLFYLWATLLGFRSVLKCHLLILNTPSEMVASARCVSCTISPDLQARLMVSRTQEARWCSTTVMMVMRLSPNTPSPSSPLMLTLSTDHHTTHAYFCFVFASKEKARMSVCIVRCLSPTVGRALGTH